MTPTSKARIEQWVMYLLIPVFAAAISYGAQSVRLEQKETREEHSTDIARLHARNEEIMSLLLDVRCEQNPHDRRCNP